MTMATYRIVSFDGGGIRGLLTTTVLERLDAALPGWFGRADLLAGNSTGGIIALGLASGLSAASLSQLYYDKGQVIFNDSWVDNLRDIGRLTGAQYSNRGLRRVLAETLDPTATLGDLGKKVLIVTFDLDNQDPDPSRRTWKAKFYHNYAGVDSDAGANVVDLAMYTSAAPTYFPSVDGFIDGAVAANNPSMAALAQTQDRRAEIDDRPALDELVLLSFGTGAVANYIVGARLNWGIAQWGAPLINIMIEGVGAVATYQCFQLLRDRFHRVQPILPPDNPIALDQWQKRDDLVAYGQAYNLDSTIAWLQKFWL
jgi:patatin-like phospholipase/acyl hydrolase